MSVFDAQTVPLSGLNLVEASAGTGKTFTLAELYCRLVVEQALEVKQILVVTYTRAATEELRSRLRKRLVAERQKLSQQGKEQSKPYQRLQLAIQSFDEAAIYTIHGFCQRALQDFAFESGHFFDMEMISDEQEIKQAVADDFWRRHIATADVAFARYLLSKKQTPETLLQAVANLPGKPYLHYLPLPEIDAQKAEQQALDAFDALKSCWHNYQTEVIDILSDNSLLKATSYRQDWVLKWLMYLEQLLNQVELPTQIFEQLDRFTRAKLEPALKKGQTLPAHPFWAHAEQFLTSYQQLQTARDVQLQHCRMQLARYLSEELPKRKQQLKVQAFDDLLLNLQQALKGEHSDKLVEQIRQQFQAALIDEFQDTDPVQYDCFNTIFSGSHCPVFFVGDPKQAIYSFRGADIFTYLKAKHASENEYNLATNWRSHPFLVEAVNVLFERTENPFIYQQIPFHPVGAARDVAPALTIDECAEAPLEFVWIGSDDAKPINVGEMQQQAAMVTAQQIAEMMTQSAAGKLQLKDKQETVRELNGGDIAVLVRSHKQGTLIQQALRLYGINSVQQSRDNVFQSEQAMMLEQVLLAIANPSHDQLIATALSTALFNKTALEIYQLQQDDLLWLEQSDFFVSLHEKWLHSGFIVMFCSLLEHLSVAKRLLQKADGERQLTNLMHLAELVQAYASRHNTSIESIMTWLAAERLASASSQDAAQIRLESDEQLVKVITIHTSKGLEYPIVFCPFLWHQGKPKEKPALMFFHQGEQQEACVAFGEPGFSEGESIAAEEEKAEDLRLLYVALTRARERCIVIWGAAKNCENSALYALLHKENDKPDAAEMRAELVTLTACYPQQMQFKQAVSSDQQVVPLRAAHTSSLTVREFQGFIPKPWQIGSFTGLTRGQHIEKPDHDAEVFHPVEEIAPVVEQVDRFSFPRGANAGTCLHSLFEHWDFQSLDDDWLQLVNKTLNQYGIDCEKWSPVVIAWLNEVVQTPLNEQGLCLKSISPGQRLDEMAFYFPVSQLSVTRLKKALQPYLADMPMMETLLKQLNFDVLTGFMKGFIDLVFEHDGRFYIVDYKSNWLGRSETQYQQNALNEAMLSHAYPLQYLIYSLALHRYLKLRLPDYDPEQHLGGIYYLFIRGMKPDWAQSGVYHHRPDTALLNALDNCMQEWGNE